MIMQKCPEHGYTMKSICNKCKKETKPAHYKFIKIKDAKDKEQD